MYNKNMYRRRPGYLMNFGQFVITTTTRVPSIRMTNEACPPGYQYQCTGGGIPCQDGYPNHCRNGFPCICIK